MSQCLAVLECKSVKHDVMLNHNSTQTAYNVTSQNIYKTSNGNVWHWESFPLCI